MLETTTISGGVDFLRRLAGDDDFRARLQENAAAVLGDYGIDPNRVPTAVQLPSKEEVQRALAGMVRDADALIKPAARSSYSHLWWEMPSAS